MNLQIALFAAVLILFAVVRVVVPLAAKGGLTRRWQLWTLGEPRTAKAPHRDNIVM